MANWESQDAAEITNSPDFNKSLAIDFGTPDIEKHLIPGMSAVLDMQPEDLKASRYEGEILGWRQKKFVVWQTQIDTDNKWRVFHDNDSVLRFFNDGRACAFKTRIIDWHVQDKSRIVYMKWPRELRYRILRNYRRINTELLCQAETKSKDTLWGTLLQLSETGARVYLPVQKVDDPPVRITFNLPSGVPIERLSCTVRHASRKDDGIVFGCETAPNKLQPDQHHAIDAFITMSLSMQSPQKDSAFAAVIIDQDPHRHHEFVNVIRERGEAAVVFHDVLSCFAWLQTQGCAAIYVNSDHASMPADEFTRTIKRSAHLSNTPVYHFGGQTSDGESRAQDCGANYLAELATEDKVIDSVLMHIKQRRSMN